MIDVAIIGAGMAGLACARRLTQAGVRPVLFNKERGIGGRVATRRAEGLQYDHGAQYVTARGGGFAAVLRDLETAGAAAPWAGDSGRARIVGVPGMSALAGAMAARRTSAWARRSRRSSRPGASGACAWATPSTVPPAWS